jgi:hypothetical protein
LKAAGGEASDSHNSSPLNLESDIAPQSLKKTMINPSIRPREVNIMASDVTLIATAAISGAVAVLVAGVGAFTTTQVANLETSRKSLEYQLKRRSERQETYQTAIDLLTDRGWRQISDPKYDIVREFTVPFVRTANRVRVYGGPASIAAMDEIQEGFAMSNRAKGESEREAAEKAIRIGHDHLVVAARADVGPRAEDDLKDVPFHQGAGPSAR